MAASSTARRSQVRPSRPERQMSLEQRQKAARVALHYGQSQAWQAHHQDGYRIISIFAGSGGGKTWLGPRFFYPIVKEKPGATFLFVEPTWRMLKRIMLPVLDDFYGAFGLGRMHLGDMVYVFNNGARIIFGSVDNPNSLQGVHIDGGIWADEIGLYAEEAWDVLLQRAALYRAPILNTSTPYTLPWCEKRLHKPTLTARNKRSHEYWLLQFPSYWNPAYPKEQYWELKRTWPKDKFDRLMRGLFTRIGGLMFDEIKEDRNLADIYPIEGTNEYPYRLYFKHPREGSRIVNLVETWAAQDWGWNPDPGCQLLCGRDEEGRIYVFAERYETQVPVVKGTNDGGDTWTSRALEWVERWGINVLWCDPSRPEYIVAMREHGVPAAPANAKVSYGAEVVNETALSLRDGSAGLYISIHGCPNLVRTYGSYVRKKGHGDEEYLPIPADGQEDHAPDTLRYLLVGDKKEERETWGAPPSVLGAPRG